MNLTQFKNNDDLLQERNAIISSTLSALEIEDKSENILKCLKTFIKYLPTYRNLQELINEEFLNQITPIVKNCLKKLFEQNSSIFDTADDDFIFDILRENLKIIIEFIGSIRTILEFILKNDEIDFALIKSIILDFGHSLLSSFKGCKESPDGCKEKCNSELSNVFLSLQEVHRLLLKLIELCVIPKECDILAMNKDSKGNDHGLLIYRMKFEFYIMVYILYHVLSCPSCNPEKNSSSNRLLNNCYKHLMDRMNKNEVLATTRILGLLCDLSNVLTSMNIKSTVDNWKTYTSVCQKWCEPLGDTVNLHIPFEYLISEIQKNITSMDGTDNNLIVQVVKVTGFLVKVLLKICDIFWQHLENLFEDICNGCLIFYSHSLQKYVDLKVPEDTLLLIDNSLFICLEPLIQRLVTESWFRKHVGPFLERASPPHKPISYLNFYNSLLKSLLSNTENLDDFDIRNASRQIFNLIEECEMEVVWSNKPNTLFNSLHVNLTSTISLFGKYEEVEMILLENLLHGHIGRALFAIHVWSQILREADEQTSMEVLTSFINFIRNSDFGIFTARSENIFLKHFVKIIYQMISNDSKTKLFDQYPIQGNVKLWKMVGLHFCPINQTSVIENLISTTITKIEQMNDSSSLDEITYIGEHLELLSTVNFKEIKLNCTPLISALNTLWSFEVSPELLENNIFEYFINRLEKITSALISEFSSLQLLVVLDQLLILSRHASYKLLAASVLSSVARSSFRFMFEFGDQNKQRVLAQVVSIISQNLASSNGAPLELLKRFSANAQYAPVVQGVVKTLNDAEGRRVRDYLRGDCEPREISGEMLKEAFAFQHECIEWSTTDVVQQACKRFKLDEAVNVGPPRKMMGYGYRRNVQYNDRAAASSSNSGQTSTKTTEEVSDDSVSEIVDRIKGELKCLAKAVKTEKLSRKNVSDLKLLSSKIDSFL